MNDENIIHIGGKSYMKCSAILLPTNEPNPSLFYHQGLGSKEKTLASGQGMQHHKEMMACGVSKPQHLYILSNEEIKEGDYFLDRLNQLFKCDKDTLKVDKSTKDLYYKKIIATTDKSLWVNPKTFPGFEKELPRPSNSFIEAFVKSQGKIEEVLVEYEAYCKHVGTSDFYTKKEIYPAIWDFRLKVAPDNTITIKSVDKVGKSIPFKELVEFAMWYSGMNQEKVVNAYNRWLVEK